jgi:hypothetical protein
MSESASPRLLGSNTVSVKFVGARYLGRQETKAPRNTSSLDVALPSCRIDWIREKARFDPVVWV